MNEMQNNALITAIYLFFNVLHVEKTKIAKIYLR